MRWPVFAILAFIAVVVQLSLANVLTLHSVGGLSPDIVACLAVFIALFAHRVSALWACWILGLAMDLAPSQTGAAHVIGPHALGYVFGGYVILQLRTVVFRRRALTLGFLTFVFVVAGSIIITAILTVRGWYPHEAPLPGSPFSYLLKRFGVALYSGIIGIPMGWLLGRTIAILGFQASAARR